MLGAQELAQVRHASNHSAGDRAWSGQKAAYKEADRNGVMCDFAACNNPHIQTTEQKSHRGADRRSNQRAIHAKPRSRRNFATQSKRMRNHGRMKTHG
jgi:hypothetical protein